jgi:plastocyanin domain-containing protein
MIAALSAFRSGSARSRFHAPATRVRVRGGYDPDTIYGRAGEPVRIVFYREETARCSERVVFPAFGKSAMLPPYQDVLVELLPREPGEYEFTCQMGVLHGTLMVEGDGGDSR